MPYRLAWSGKQAVVTIDHQEPEDQFPYPDQFFEGIIADLHRAESIRFVISNIDGDSVVVGMIQIFQKMKDKEVIIEPQTDYMQYLFDLFQTPLTIDDE